MAVIGVVAEFDPFHLGHEYLIRESRARLGADSPVVVAMSGAFTQRGLPAVCRKSARTEMALGGGADLVLELPFSWAAASAQRFCRGGVELLAATGVVDHLCFGSESGDLPGLISLARCEENPEFIRAFRTALDAGAPYAAARQQAAETALGEVGRLLSGANDLLGVEYLRALPENICPVAILRRGARHNGPEEEGISSASRIREKMASGEEIAPWVPETTREIIERETADGLCPGDLRSAQRAILFRLRSMTEGEFAALPDCSEGLEHRLVRAAAEAGDLEEFYARAKTRRYTHARLRRIALWAWAGLKETDRPQQIPYIRVLGATRRGLELLREMKVCARLPVITKPAAGRKLEGTARTVLEWESRATDLWSLCLPRPLPVGEDWRTGPVLPEK